MAMALTAGRVVEMVFTQPDQAQHVTVAVTGALQVQNQRAENGSLLPSGLVDSPLVASPIPTRCPMGSSSRDPLVILGEVRGNRVGGPP